MELPLPAPVANYVQQGQKFFAKLSFNGKVQQGFLEDIGSLIQDGLPAQRAVMTYRDLSEGIEAQVANDILIAIGRGRPMADGMREWFSEATVEMIRAGEEAGTIADTMLAAAKNLSQKNDVLASLASSITYPLVVIVAGCFVSVYINTSILKQFADIKPISEWPAVGQNMTYFADFISHWWWTVLLVMFAVSFGLSRLLRDYTGVYREDIDKVPLLNIYRKLAAAQMMETLGMLIANGMVFKQALGILKRNASTYMGAHLVMMEYRLGRGQGNIADVLDTGLLDPGDLLRLRAVGEAKGFEHALIRQGTRAQERTVKLLETLGKVLGGVLMALGAGLAAFMVNAIYSVGSALS